MLNLSDKDLDRLSQEAAQQHEPGDVIGPKFWEKLEARLDRDLGKVNPNPARGIRRLPYYYAPALLVLLGLSYYLVRLSGKSHKGASSGSPPLTLVKPAQAEPLKPTTSTNAVPSDNSNSTLPAPSNTVQYPGSAGAASGAPATAVRDNPTAPSATSRPDNPSGSATTPDRSGGLSALNPSATSLTSMNSQRTASGGRPHRRLTGSNPDKRAGAAGADDATHTGLTPGYSGIPASSDEAAATNATNKPAPTTKSNNATPAPATPRDLTLSAVRGPVPIAHAGSIDDSALRAFTLSSIRQPIRKGYLHINRSLSFGIMGGPDYASVNSLGGDRAGSSIGLTIDYQFANHLYLGTGLFFSRKIFAAAGQDYHVSPDYLRQNGMGMSSGLDYVKGTFNMLEIPLNVRYDFSTTYNTLFFISAGTSSYLFTTQNCGYYFNPYNTRNVVSKQFSYTNQPDNLFATLNLSVGVELGINNNLSILLAPYAKFPTRGLGFGQVQLSSVGLDFALRFTPVLSRKR